MNIQLQPGEQEIKSGGANLQRGAETVGGKLYLTNQRLAFASHKFNLQSGATDISLDAIAETQLAWTKFLNVIPMVPNSLAVFTTDGTEHRFVLTGRKKWQEAIQAASPRAV